MKVLCKIFRNPSEEELNKFLEDVDVFSIHVVVEQAYRINAYDSELPVHCVYIFYRQ